MKKILTLLTLLAVFGLSINSANAQTKANWYEPDTVYFYHESDPDLACVREISHYNEKGSETKKVKQVWNVAQTKFLDEYQYLKTYDPVTNDLLTKEEQKMDAIWTGVIKNIYTYTGDKNTSILYKKYELAKNDYVDYEKESWNYDGEKLLKYEKEKWDDPTWEPVSRKVWTYDGDKLHYLVKWGDLGWGFIPTQREIYSYDAKNNLTETIVQEPDAPWANYEQYKYSYNDKNQKIKTIIGRWDGFDFETLRYYEDSCVYDDRGNLTKHFIEEIDIWSMGEIDNYLYERDYNEKDMLVKQVLKIYDGSLYIADSKQTYTYSTDGHYNLMSLLYEDASTGVMTPFQHHIYTYDAQNNRISWLVRLNSGAGLEDYLKTEYEYDENNNGILLTFEEYVGSNWIPKNNWHHLYYNNMKSDIFYTTAYCKIAAHYIKTHEVNAIPANMLASQILVYPNPTSDVLRVTSDGLQVLSVEIYDMMGKKQKVNNTLNPYSQKAPLVAEREMVLDVSHLANGIYFLNITTDNGIVTKKIIKH